MATTASLELDQMRGNAAEAADFLRALSNRPRLLILCHLQEAGELTVSQLVECVGISQSALSQHLARLRRDGLVRTRRASQTIYYRMAGSEAPAVLATLHKLYCSGDDEEMSVPPIPMAEAARRLERSAA